MKKSTIQSVWTRLDADRRESLDRARLCSALTKPWILPPEGWNENDKLPETFSSLPTRGVSALEGKLIVAMFPANQPFFRLKPSSKFKYDPDVDAAVLQEFQQRLHLQELTIMSQIDRADKSRTGNARRAGFRSRMRSAISQLLVTGDVLMQLLDDLTLKIYRRDMYVTKRDATGDVQFHVVKEEIDPLILNDEQLVTCDFEREVLEGQSSADRKTEMYTRCEWNPVNNRWLIQQECRGKIINEVEETVTPFMSTPFDLPPGCNYGRGLVEANLGDIRSINELTERLLDHAAMASKMLMVTDYASQVRPGDLAKPTGSVIQGRVQGGNVTDVALLKADKGQDFAVANSVRESIRKDLSSVMLMESENLPSYDRATRFHVQRVAQELDSALGGVYGSVADSLQIPLVERLREIMVRRNLLPPVPEDAVEIEAVTGIHALSQEGEQQKLLGMLQVLAQLGPETMSRINQGTLIDLLMRQSGMYEPGLIRTEEEIQQEQQAMQQQMLEAQAQQTAMQTAGKVVESAASSRENINV